MLTSKHRIWGLAYLLSIASVFVMAYRNDSIQYQGSWQASMLPSTIYYITANSGKAVYSKYNNESHILLFNGENVDDSLEFQFPYIDTTQINIPAYAIYYHNLIPHLELSCNLSIFIQKYNDCIAIGIENKKLNETYMFDINTNFDKLPINSYNFRILPYCLLVFVLLVFETIGVSSQLSKLNANESIAGSMSEIPPTLCFIGNATWILYSFYQFSTTYPTQYIWAPIILSQIYVLIWFQYPLLELIWRNRATTQVVIVYNDAFENMLNSKTAKLTIYVLLSELYFYFAFINSGVMLAVYSVLYLPQIILNMQTKKSKSISLWYIASSNLLAIGIPIYFRGQPFNFKHYKCSILYGALQLLASFLIALTIEMQKKKGSRFLFFWNSTPHLLYKYERDVSQCSAESICLICCSPVSETLQKEYMMTPCMHEFHCRCLKGWMDIKLQCPTCRSSLPELENEE